MLFVPDVSMLQCGHDLLICRLRLITGHPLSGAVISLQTAEIGFLFFLAVAAMFSVWSIQQKRFLFFPPSPSRYLCPASVK